MRLSRKLAGVGLAALFPSIALGVPTSTQWLEEVVVTGKLESRFGD